jgi:threonine dehydratase
MLKEQKLSGVIAASAGNHALALCYHGKMLKIPVVVVMPKYIFIYSKTIDQFFFILNCSKI